MTSKTMNQEAKELFESKLKGPNILTPYLLGYGVAGRFAYELSEGKDMVGRPFFGVTILERGSGYRRKDLSACFWSLSECDAHISTIRKNIGLSE